MSASAFRLFIAAVIVFALGFAVVAQYQRNTAAELDRVNDNYLCSLSKGYLYTECYTDN